LKNASEKKRVKNIVPVIADGEVYEPGHFWQTVDAEGTFYALEADWKTTIPKKAAEDPRMFEVARWPHVGYEYIYLDSNLEASTSIYTQDSVDTTRLRCGNFFHPETRLNRAGVHIDAVREILRGCLRSKEYTTRIVCEVPLP